MSKQTETDKAPKSIEEQLTAKLQEVKIIRYSPGLDNGESEVLAYKGAKDRGECPPDMSLNDYIKQTKYPNEPNAVVVVDLSGQRFEADLTGVDFTGCIMSGAQFYMCNLNGVNFRDTDLKEVSFWESSLKNADFRGADLTNCSFSKDYQKWIDPLKPGAKLPEDFDPRDPIPEDLRNPNADKLKGIKFSTTQRREREHLYQNQLKDEAIEVERQAFNKQKEEDVKAKTAERNAQYSYLRVVTGQSAEYMRLDAELEEIKKRSFDKRPDYAIDPTVLNIMSFDRNLDPAYVRGSTTKDLEVERQYLPMAKEDIEKYLERRKTEPQLSLNDFAKEQALAGTLTNQIKFQSIKVEVDPKAKVIADCSDLDLSGLDFSGANMKETCFAGARLEGCKFDRADISRSTFEGASVQGASFVDTNARQANFFTSDLQEAQITGSDFGRAFMSLSKAEKAEISAANFDFANIKNGKWDGVRIVDSNFNGSNLEGVSLIGAYVKGVSAQHAILKDAHMEKAQVIASDFRGSMMQGLQAMNAEFKETVLENVKAPFANFESVKFDELTKLDGADLENAILDYVKAEKASFKEVNLNGAKARQADFTDASLEQASVQFADLEGAILKGARANNVDMTGCNLQKVDAKQAIFTDAVMKDVQAQQADLEQAICDGADLRGAQLQGAILKEVQARKAKLQQVETDKSTQAQSMNVDGATVDHGTEELTGARGTVEREGVDGSKEKIDIEKHNEQAVNIKKEKEATTLGKFFAGACSYLSAGAKKTGEFIRQPFSSKTGAIVGVTLGLVAAAAIITSVVFTAGLSIPVMIGVAAGVAGGCALVGGVGGYFGAKHVGGLEVVGAVAGIGGGAPGVAIGMAVAKGANKVVEKGTGKSVNEWGAQGVEFVGDLADQGHEAFRGGGKLAEEQLEAQKAQKGQYKKAEKSQAHKPTISVQEFGLQSEHAAKQGLDSSPSVRKRKKETILEPTESVKEKEGQKKGFINKIKDRILGPHTKKVMEDKSKGAARVNQIGGGI